MLQDPYSRANEVLSDLVRDIIGISEYWAGVLSKEPNLPATDAFFSFMNLMEGMTGSFRTIDLVDTSGNLISDSFGLHELLYSHTPGSYWCELIKSVRSSIELHRIKTGARITPLYCFLTLINLHAQLGHCACVWTDEKSRFGLSDPVTIPFERIRQEIIRLIGSSLPLSGLK